MTVATHRPGGGGSHVDRYSGGGSSGLADVIELILDKGLVIDVFVRVSLVGIEILTIDARIVVAAGAVLPEGLRGLGPSGTVSLVADGRVAAVVGDVPLDRPLGTREDLMTHETVIDAVAGATTILPMRFPAVVEEKGVVAELL